MKTISEIQEEVAVEKGYESLSYVSFFNQDFWDIMEAASIRYAEQALDEAAEKSRIYARIDGTEIVLNSYETHDGAYFKVDKQSIINLKNELK